MNTPTKLPAAYIPKYKEVSVDADCFDQPICCITNVVRKLGNKSIFAVAVKEFDSKIASMIILIFFDSLFLSTLSLLYCRMAFLILRF